MASLLQLVFVIMLRLVVTVQLIDLDDFYQPLGIGRTGGIAAGLQSLGPSFVVGRLQFEQTAVTLAALQEFRMVFKTLVRIIVSPETLVSLVIIVISRAPCPPVTLDAEVVVGFASQLTTSRSRFQYPLCQGNAGRNAKLLLLFDGYVLIEVNIFLEALVPDHLLCRSAPGVENNYQNDEYIPFHEKYLLLACKSKEK